ncbi:kinase-like protein [Suillus weaverae]|nr:kinase-like protein [Suillus weaverae]
MPYQLPQSLPGPVFLPSIRDIFPEISSYTQALSQSTDLSPISDHIHGGSGITRVTRRISYRTPWGADGLQSPTSYSLIDDYRADDPVTSSLEHVASTTKLCSLGMASSQGNPHVQDTGPHPSSSVLPFAVSDPPSYASTITTNDGRRPYLKSPKLYQCPHCDKRFNRLSSLRIHFRMHTGPSFPYPQKLPVISSREKTFLHLCNNEPDDSPLEEMLDLSKYITKDEEYPIARGGFGEIWKCTYHNRRPAKVAVKSLHVYAADQMGTAKEKKIKRITRELRICASLKHANILPVYGYTYGFGPFIAIVCPWAENGDLTTYLAHKGETLTLVRRFQILRDIIAGLQYLHANSVIHGDITGPNVLINGDGTACVADFGLALMYSEAISASQASWTSTLKGNMRWMAPELLVEQEDGSSPRPSKQSDIYSFGGIMLQLRVQVLTNKIPYYHLSSDAAIILCIAKSQKPCRSRYPVLPDEHWKIIEQCWSTDPQVRPSTEKVDGEIKNEFQALSRSC